VVIDPKAGIKDGKMISAGDTKGQLHSIGKISSHAIPSAEVAHAHKLVSITGESGEKWEGEGHEPAVANF
jgi:hypothetical protein